VQEVWHQKVDEQRIFFREIQESLGTDFWGRFWLFFGGFIKHTQEEKWGLDQKKGKHHKDL